MIDNYAKKYINAIKNSLTDEELTILINKIYEDGFQDGASEGSKSK